ncbi:hypothetical protein GCM10027443_17550 [Pontibacter brevis]
MRIFENDLFKEQATKFIKDWTRLLSEGKFQEAIDLLDHSVNEKSDLVWTKETLKEAFLDYGEIGRMPIINDPYLMGSEGDIIDFYKYDDGSGWAVDYDIPLDGERGDLTAQFSFKKASGEMYSIFLQDLHAL